MKILCVSDFVDPLIYNQRVKEMFPDIDLILCAGDLPMDYIDFIVTVFNKPTYFIFGNHNLKEFHFYHRSARMETHHVNTPYGEITHGHGATYIGFKTETNYNLAFEDPNTHKKTPLLIAGASGTLTYNNGMNQYTDFQMKMFNVDGTEAEMCGNGIRCISRFAFENGIVNKKNMSVETKPGIK